jgi:hypothetical protein
MANLNTFIDTKNYYRQKLYALIVEFFEILSFNPPLGFTK